MSDSTKGYHQFTASGENYGMLKMFCKENRRFMTDAESILWNHLRGGALGCRFRRQHIVNNFIADFISIRHKMIIEIDGLYHSLPEQMIADAERTSILENLGYKVIRFSNDDIIGNIQQVTTRIKQEMEKIEKTTNAATAANMTESAPLLGRGRGRLYSAYSFWYADGVMPMLRLKAALKLDVDLKPTIRQMARRVRLP